MPHDAIIRKNICGKTLGKSNLPNFPQLKNTQYVAMDRVNLGQATRNISADTKCRQRKPRGTLRDEYDKTRGEFPCSHFVRVILFCNVTRVFGVWRDQPTFWEG